jgi:hypothetical protein
MHNEPLITLHSDHLRCQMNRARPTGGASLALVRSAQTPVRRLSKRDVKIGKTSDRVECRVLEELDVPNIISSRAGGIVAVGGSEGRRFEVWKRVRSTTSSLGIQAPFLLTIR